MKYVDCKSCVFEPYCSPIGSMISEQLDCDVDNLLLEFDIGDFEDCDNGWDEMSYNRYTQTILDYNPVEQ